MPNLPSSELAALKLQKIYLLELSKLLRETMLTKPNQAYGLAVNLYFHRTSLPETLLHQQGLTYQQVTQARRLKSEDETAFINAVASALDAYLGMEDIPVPEESLTE